MDHKRPTPARYPPTSDALFLREQQWGDAHVMPRRVFDDQEVHQFLMSREQIATHAELQALGVPLSTITYRIRPRGPWQRGLPGVVIAHRGTPTRRERLLVALAYGGPTSMITGRPSLRLQISGLRQSRGLEIPHLLIPHEHQRTSHHFVIVERTREMPVHRCVSDIRVAPIPRSTADATRRDKGLDDVRELVSDVAQNGRLDVDDLVSNLRTMATQRSAPYRLSLEEVSDGVRSVAEARARELVLDSDLPEVFIFNPTLWTPVGELIGSPDGYVTRIAAGYEIDSFAYHLGRESYLRTQRRHRDVSAHGVLTLGFSPIDVVNEPKAFVEDLRDFLTHVAQRQFPDVIVRPR